MEEEKKLDVWHSVMKWIDYNRGKTVGLVVALFICVGLASCVPKTLSLVEPGVKVTAPELAREVVVVKTELEKRAITLKADEEKYNADVTAANAKIEAAEGDIQRQVEIRTKIVEIAGGIGVAAMTGTVNPAAGAAAALQIVTLLVGGGAILDNRRKDKVIKEVKEANGKA